jgi:predicted HicB family RNase H-like nuclease
MYNPWIFNVEVPSALFIILFIFGSWQFGIHFVKMIIRSAKKVIEKVKYKTASQESLKDFEKEYKQAVKDYLEDVSDDGERNQSIKK